MQESVGEVDRADDVGLVVAGAYRRAIDLDAEVGVRVERQPACEIQDTGAIAGPEPATCFDGDRTADGAGAAQRTARLDDHCAGARTGTAAVVCAQHSVANGCAT